MPAAAALAVTIGLTIAGADRSRAIDKQVSFIGFSSDESVAAWRIDIQSHDPAERYSDHYTLVRVVDPRSNQIVQTYRGSAIRRVNRRGGPMKSPAQILATLNPKWKKAAPHEAWLDIEKQGRFASQNVEAARDFVVITDPDVQLEATVEGNEFYLIGQPFGALGFSVAYRGARLVHLGRFRQEARRQETLVAKLRIYASKSGGLVALLSRFAGEDTNRALTYGTVAAVPTRRSRGAAGSDQGSAAAPAPVMDAPSGSLKGLINNYRRSYLEIY